MKHEITARRITEMLSETGLKPVELAERTGINKASISQYVNGTHAPSNVSAGKMAPVLGGVNPVWLMGFDVPKYLDTSSSDVQTFAHPKSYYENDDTRKIAQKVFDDPALRVLFDAADDATPEDILTAAELLKKFKDARRD